MKKFLALILIMFVLILVFFSGWAKGNSSVNPTDKKETHMPPMGGMDY